MAVEGAKGVALTPSYSQFHIGSKEEYSLKRAGEVIWESTQGSFVVRVVQAAFRAISFIFSVGMSGKAAVQWVASTNISPWANRANLYPASSLMKFFSDISCETGHQYHLLLQANGLKFVVSRSESSLGTADSERAFNFFLQQSEHGASVQVSLYDTFGESESEQFTSQSVKWDAKTSSWNSDEATEATSLTEEAKTLLTPGNSSSAPEKELLGALTAVATQVVEQVQGFVKTQGVVVKADKSRVAGHELPAAVGESLGAILVYLVDYVNQANELHGILNPTTEDGASAVVGAVVSTKEKLAGAIDQVRELLQQVEKLNKANADLRGEGEEGTEKTNAEHKQQVQALEEAKAAVLTQYNEVVAQVKTITDQHRAALTEAQTESAALRFQVDSLQDEAGASSAAKAELQKQLDETIAKLADAERSIESARAELSKNKGLQKQLDEMTPKLTAAEEASAAAKTEIEEKTTLLSEKISQLARMSSKLEAAERAVTREVDTVTNAVKRLFGMDRNQFKGPSKAAVEAFLRTHTVSSPDGAGATATAASTGDAGKEYES